MADMDSPNYAEYAVEKKVEGSLRVRRLLMILFYVALAGGYFSVCVTTFVALIAVLPMLMLIVIYFTWLYVSYDVSYTFSSGTMRFCRVYGSRSRRIEREMLSLEVRDALYVGLAENPRAKERLSSVRRVYDFASSSQSSDAVILIFEEENGSTSAVRFDCINRVARLLRIFAPAADLEGLKFRF